MWRSAEVPLPLVGSNSNVRENSGNDLCCHRALPGPLPKEREKRSPRFLEYRATGLAGQSFANHKTCDGFSFSPGEKAGMRAGVETNFQWSATFRPLQGAKAGGAVISITVGDGVRSL